MRVTKVLRPKGGGKSFRAGQELKLLGLGDPVLRDLFLSGVPGQYPSTLHDSKMFNINSKHIGIFNNTPSAN